MKCKEFDNDESSNAASTLRIPKQSRMSTVALESDNDLGIFGPSIKKTKAVRLPFEEKSLKREERMQQEMIEKRHHKLEERCKEAERCDACEMRRI